MHTIIIHIAYITKLYGEKNVKERERERERERDRDRQRQTDRDRQTETDRQTDNTHRDALPDISWTHTSRVSPAIVGLQSSMLSRVSVLTS